MFKPSITFVLALLLATTASTIAAPVAQPQHGTLLTWDTSLSRRDDSSKHLERRVQSWIAKTSWALAGAAILDKKRRTNKRLQQGPILPMHNGPASQAHDGAGQSNTTPGPSTQAHDGTQTPAGQSNTSDGRQGDHLSSLMPKTGQKPHARGDTKEPAHNTPEMV